MKKGKKEMEENRYRSSSDWQRSDLKSKGNVELELRLSRLLDYWNDEVPDKMRKGAVSLRTSD